MPPAAAAADADAEEGAVAKGASPPAGASRAGAVAVRVAGERTEEAEEGAAAAAAAVMPGARALAVIEDAAGLGDEDSVLGLLKAVVRTPRAEPLDIHRTEHANARNDWGWGARAGQHA